MLRLRQICLVARRLKPAVADLESAFGLATCFQDPGVAKYGLENALLPIGNDFLEIVAPVAPNTAAERYLDRRNGDGGYMVILQSDDVLTRRAQIEAAGVRVINTHDHDDFYGIQLHPRDTGGAMLEIDRNDGDDASDSPWRPAGDDWKRAVRTDVTTAMTGAELQSDDPAGLAARWGAILDIAPKTGNDGVAALQLDNATLRFVPVADGRGEGLGGVDLKMTPGVQPGAQYVEETKIICGTRFRLIE
ncbi:MAG: hypothetical protein HOM25_20850 [Rhodospirillaceae bacterium]|jgi:hypothetical protein|nr:hypothetical protein [Rhodospirillaceae bacterium]